MSHTRCCSVFSSRYWTSSHDDSTVAGVVVALVALTISIPVSIATVAFYVVFRWFEDYL